MTTFRRLVAATLGVAVLATAPVAAADDGSRRDPGYNGAPTVRSGGPVPTMNGVPCVGGHLGTCTGFAQNQPDRPAPRARIGGTPTIRP
ncbi:hypothetical protein [Mycolicibacterium grossiae]|uniref:Intersectin-EH binding protein Ibp1 n=1 Tax=Mycolicibacterium grossiae TaxID=1552759 RepID=A0A1E8PVR3_9MYCO|nr:hypothetical protein [Mycolicibacterium grossiae]OFJ50395.1 hypothetical protein BEL07_28460 [Mycolicibacterium grossiae]QEM44908.1 hypothetical protein FZ046_09020 [Mycolicibacterium grossiae]